MMRRLLAGLAVTILAVLAITPSASADESINSGAWSGSRLDPQPGPSSSGQLSVTGRFERLLSSISLQFTITASDGGCSVPKPPDAGAAASPRAVSLSFGVQCNGRYKVRVDARSSYGETASLDQTITVTMPAPTVSGVTATADDAGRSVEVTWDDMRPGAPDLSGYVVERKVGDEPFEELATVDAGEQAYTDEELPTDGGEATYRVFATRPVPDGTVTSQSSTEAATPFQAAPTDSTDRGGSGPGGDGGSGADGGGTAGSGGSSGSGDRTSPTVRNRVTAPRSTFPGTFLPPLLRPTPLTVRPATATTVDGGFDQSLPYDPEAGGDDPVLPEDDEMALVLGEAEPGRGMAIPLATALVLAVWAFHLRVLARAARPQP